MTDQDLVKKLQLFEHRWVTEGQLAMLVTNGGHHGQQS